MPATKETSAKDYTPQSTDERTNFMDVFPQPPEPATELARYRILAPTAGVRVSPLCLGAMSLGDQWSGFMGKALDYEMSCELLDAFYESGGNFIDTANNYQDQQSEWIVGDWMKARGIRDEIVLATKYTTPYLADKNGPYKGIGVNYAGNHKKSLKHSVEDSLRKLSTDYIDLLYVHWWDHSTGIEELMQSLGDLVRSGKVLYLGISDTPAWIVAAANEYARQHALPQFVVYQGLYNLATRDMERDIIPMCRKYGMAIAPWGALGQGKFKLQDDAQFRGGADQSPNEVVATKALNEMAQEIGGGVKLVDVALAWVRAKVAYNFPIVGGTNIAHLKQNVKSLEIELTPAQVQKLDAAVPFDPGFPLARFGNDPHYLPGGKPDSFLVNMSGKIKFHESSL